MPFALKLLCYILCCRKIDIDHFGFCLMSVVGKFEFAHFVIGVGINVEFVKEMVMLNRFSTPTTIFSFHIKTKTIITIIPYSNHWNILVLYDCCFKILWIFLSFVIIVYFHFFLFTVILSIAI